MTSAERYDAIVIGVGQGGGPLARTLAGAGWKAAINEREHPDGTCVNVGCTPTKTNPRRRLSSSHLWNF